MGLRPPKRLQLHQLRQRTKKILPGKLYETAATITIDSAGVAAQKLEETMPRTLTKEEIFELPVEERLELIETIWDSMSPNDVPVPERHKRALDAALEELRQDPDGGESWEDVRAGLPRGR